MDSTVPNGAHAIAVLCHPHPNHGGDRFNNVVEAFYRALPEAGIGALRFDFRRPVPDGDLSGAVADIAAACAEARRLLPGSPLVLVGYSYGAAAALASMSAVGDLAGLVLVAPPLTLAPPVVPTMPTLAVIPAHDQFSPPAVVEPVVAGWPEANVEVVDMADHFLHGRTDAVARAATTWLTTRLPSGAA